jgi:hypothetical protein
MDMSKIYYVLMSLTILFRACLKILLGSGG